MASSPRAIAHNGARMKTSDRNLFRRLRLAAVIMLLPRYRPGWPAPGAYDTEAPRSKFTGLGAPRPALPVLMVHNMPICAATVRLGPGHIEVHFFATTESRRNRGA